MGKSIETPVACNKTVIPLTIIVMKTTKSRIQARKRKQKH